MIMCDLLYGLRLHCFAQGTMTPNWVLWIKITKKNDHRNKTQRFSIKISAYGSRDWLFFNNARSNDLWNVGFRLGVFYHGTSLF